MKENISQYHSESVSGQTSKPVFQEHHVLSGSTRIEQKTAKTPTHMCPGARGQDMNKDARVYKDPSNEQRPIKKSCSLLLLLIYQPPFLLLALSVLLSLLLQWLVIDHL